MKKRPLAPTAYRLPLTAYRLPLTAYESRFFEIGDQYRRQRDLPARRRAYRLPVASYLENGLTNRTPEPRKPSSSLLTTVRS
jgi:hypothetical protein